MLPEDVATIAAEYGLDCIDYQPDSRMISFSNASRDIRVNVYYTRMTVGTCLTHPKKGKTQLFRRNVTEPQLRAIFQNPRVHLNTGYRKKKWQRTPLILGEKK